MRLADIGKIEGIEKVYIVDDEFQIEKGYCCDLMSEVIGCAEPDSVWITVHNNMNVLGVAVMIDIKCVIIAEGHEITESFLSKAMEEGISLFKSERKSFELAGRLYAEGVR